MGAAGNLIKPEISILTNSLVIQILFSMRLALWYHWIYRRIIGIVVLFYEKRKTRFCIFVGHSNNRAN
jgi:hypothetical protein